MKKKIIVLLTVFTLVCLTGCGSEEKTSVVENHQQSLDDDSAKKPKATTEPTSTPEAVVESTPEATEELAPEPTEESVLYEGIDMESTLPGIDWMKTFIGVIDEPKVLVYSDETGRKEFIEDEDVVLINPDVDVIAIYLPEGYKRANKSMGIQETEVIVFDYCAIFVLDPEETRKHKFEMAALYFKRDGELFDTAIDFVIESE